MKNLVIGVDPGLKSPSHCYLSAGGALFATKPFAVDRGIRVLVEGQYPRDRSSRQSLITLSFSAGLAAGAYLAQGARVYTCPPQAWRNALIPSSGRYPKTVFHNICIRDGLLPSEAVGWDLDQTDAYLIGLALTKRKLKKFAVKWSANEG